MSEALFKNLLIERRDPGIQIVKINRPTALNALNTDTLKELRIALTSIHEDPHVRCVIFTGEGEKSFIAGADILEMKGLTPEEGAEFSQVGHQVAFLLESMPAPVIAAVNGYALGGGTEMALACDFILASDNAVFGQPEVGLGIIPGFGATFRLMKHVGLPRARELIYTGRKLKADEALRMGLVNAVFPKADFRSKVDETAQEIARQSSPAVKRAKKLINEFSESVGFNFKRDAEAHAFGRLFGTEDQKEGMGAFSEKRKPKFVGLES